MGGLRPPTPQHLVQRCSGPACMHYRRQTAGDDGGQRLTTSAQEQCRRLRAAQRMQELLPSSSSVAAATRGAKRVDYYLEDDQQFKKKVRRASASTTAPSTHPVSCSSPYPVILSDTDAGSCVVCKGRPRWYCLGCWRYFCLQNGDDDRKVKDSCNEVIFRYRESCFVKYHPTINHNDAYRRDLP